MTEAPFEVLHEEEKPRIAGGIAIARFLNVLRRQPSAADNARARLALAGEKALQRSAEAVDLFADLAREHDLREAWLGLALAHHLRGDPVQASDAIGRAMRCHAFDRETVPPLAQAIAQAIDAAGWCALDGTGELIVQLSRLPPHGTRPTATLDGRILALRSRSRGPDYTAHLPEGWDQAAEMAVRLGDNELLGSPISIRRIVQVEGFVDSIDGDLHGWAWCPHAPDRSPVLSIEALDGATSITAVAESRAVEIRHERPLAVPRRFRIPPDQLRRFDGPVRVRGNGSAQLTGSPIDPSAERRNAERATRMIADRLSAIDHHGHTNSGDIPLLSVPAHVIGGPVLGGFKRRPVDVVVPVYGRLELTLACLDSVLADLPRWARVVVVNDASPDPSLAQELGKLATRRQRLTLLNQSQNRGFPGTANVGMRHDITRDVVLLNSDTLVPPGWLKSLREAAYSAFDIGTATPLSNDATILSYPSVEHTNAVPTLSETIHIDTLAQRANAGQLVDIPTAVGFCTYIKRDCLNATGLLREDIFAQGYGEENDFCLRARHLGWRHVAVPSMFVAHVGGQSFGSRRHHLIERNLRTLNQLHPGYDALIQDFQSTDPLAGPRRRMDIERWKTYRTRARSVLLITHDRGGGVQRYVAGRAAALRAEGFRPIVLWPVASRQGGGRDCVLGNGPEGGTINLRFAIPGELGLLTRLLVADRPVRAEVHHMIGHDHQLMDLFRRLSIPYEIVIHDYSWLCPRVNLVGAERRYCGEPAIEVCEACVADAGATNDENTQPAALRERTAAEFLNASKVIVPSADVAARLRRHFPSVQPNIGKWEDDALLPQANPTPVAADGMRRICIVGAIAIEKGYDVLLACGRDAKIRKLPLRFHLVGHSYDDSRLRDAGVQITDEYDEQEAVALIQKQQSQLAWMPSIWPETWCYTLTLAWQAGLNVLAFDIGTPAERIRRSGRGWLVPLSLTPERLNNHMLALHPTEIKRELPSLANSKTPGFRRSDDPISSLAQPADSKRAI